MPAGKLKLSTVQAYAPGLARDLFDRFDFSPSITKGEPSLDVGQAYKIVERNEYLALAAIQKHSASDKAWGRGILGSLGTSAVAGIAAALGAFGHADSAVMILGAIGFVGSLGVGAAVGDGLSNASKELKSHVVELTRERPKALTDQSDR